MAFGQQSGPPASAKQLAYLLSLVQQAGHDGFRDARHPLGLTQRQAGGKFSTREASELIDRLLGGEFGDVDDDDRPPPGTTPARTDSDRARAAGTGTRASGGRGAGASSVDRRAEVAAERAQQRLDDQRAELIAGVPADDLVAELERRGWTCVAPDEAPPRATTRRAPR